MRFIDGAVFFPKSKTLVLADLHLGYEAEMRAKGVHVPSQEFLVLYRRIVKILAHTKPKTVVVNGDFKHSFGHISDSEWRSARQLLELLTKDRNVVLIVGNHDPVLFPIAEKFGVALQREYLVDDMLILHGDKLPQTTKEFSCIVIGHEHPAISVSDGVRSELVKCYLVGTWKNKDLIVLPSMFSLTEGTDVLSEQFLSPFLSNVNDFFVYALSEGEVLPFGTVKDVKQLRK